MTLAPGTTVGRYQILEPLGQGGMATVYKAFQPSLEREVALKVLRPGFAQDQEFRERFEREAKSIARLRHPNIVQVFDFEVSTSGEFVLAMEFLDGGTLKDRMVQLAATGRALEPTDTVRILWEVADALSYAHEQGIVHRDVKPSNVMLAKPRDRAVVTDFGIARILGATSHTQTGVGIGTPEYMAPEQGQGGTVDHRADIYSLGAMAYELLVGRVPYTADTPLAVVIAHIKDPLPLPSKVNPTIGQGVERALLKALAKDPAQRHDSAIAFAQALRDGLTEDTRGGTMPTIVVRGADRTAATARPATAAPPRPIGATMPAIITRRPVVLGVAGAVVLAIVAGTVIASNALRPSTVAVPPAATAGKLPARGALIWQAKLDGTDVDTRGVQSGPAGSDPTANEFRFVPGAIEYVVHKSTSTGSGRGFQLNSPARESFVFEVDVDAQAALSLQVNWWEASQQRYGMGIDVKNGRVQLVYSKPGGIIEPLTAAAPADDIRRANPFTAAVVVERTRFTAYVGGRQIVQAAPDGRVPPVIAPVGVIIAGNELGTVRLTGIRLYELPSGTAGSAPSAPSSTITPASPPPPGLSFAAMRGSLIHELRQDDAVSVSGPNEFVKFTGGVLELTTPDAGTRVEAMLGPVVSTQYAAEMDVLIAANSVMRFAVCLRGDGAQRYCITTLAPGGSTSVKYLGSETDVGAAWAGEVNGAIPNGRKVHLAYVVDLGTFTVFVDDRAVLQVKDPPTRFTNSRNPVSFQAQRIRTVPDQTGTAQVSGIKIYALIAPSAAAAPASTPTPTPKYSVPAKGALLYEAKLDGTPSDFLTPQITGTADVRSRPGTVEFTTANESSQASVRLNGPTVTTFVGELELNSKVAPPTDVYFQWQIKECAQQGGVNLTLWPATESIRIMDNLPDRTFTFLTGELPAPVGRGAVVAIVVETSRITVYVDQRQLAQVEHTRCGGTLRPQLSIGAGKGGGSVNVTGLRIYNLP